MERKPDTTKPGLYVVVNSGRKRKPNLPAQYTSAETQFVKRRPRIVNGNGELCFPTGQSCSQNVNVFRNQMSVVANSVIASPRPKLHRIQRRPGAVCQSAGDELQEIMIGTMTDDDRISRDSMYADPPMCVFPDGVMHPMFVDPERLTDIDDLRQALNRANLMIRELLNREKKQLKERDYFKNRMDAESQRAEEIEYILNEQTLRMKQVVSENVRWSTRYNQLKLHFGEEDIKNALGDLAPSGR
ncbi:hypothetical protein FO519_004093 [Halicephalobus sp. NKZ332]|nr:hypothetical protein FO519_004093 [Halicephalobus sp. NKZ332]